MFIFLRYKNLIIIAGIFIVSLMIVRGLYAGYQREKYYLADQAAQLEKRIEWAGKIEDIEKKLAETDNKLIKGDVFYFNKLVEKVAQESGVFIESVRPNIVEETAQYRKAEVSLQVTGNYGSVTAFIEALEKTGVVEIVSFRRWKAVDDYTSSFDIKFTGLLTAQK